MPTVIDGFVSKGQGRIGPVLRVALLAAPLHGVAPAELAQPVVRAAREELGVELVPVEPAELSGEPLPALLMLTGGTERAALSAAQDLPGPVLVLSHSGHNSLPAALETVAALQSQGRVARLVHLGREEHCALREFLAARDLALRLRRHHVCWIGGASPWLAASSPGAELFQRKLGLHVSELALSELRERLPTEASPTPDGEGVGIGPEERAGGARVLAALERLVQEQGFTAVSIACFGLLGEGLTACWALARLADRGVPAGCEGDLPALLALIAAHELSGRPGFLANPADIDRKRGRVVLAHCTVPLSLTSAHRLRTHFESGLGLAVEGDVQPGAYTLARFGGAELEQGFFVEGSVLSERVGRDDLCRTQAIFKLPRGAAELLLRRPLGNHHVLIPGHHRRALETFHELFLA